MNAPTSITAIFVDHGKLRPSPTQPRKRKGFDEASLNELADSIRAVGIAQPILVRERVEKTDGCEVIWLEIVAGERRWRAAKIAGLEQVPVIIKTLTDLEVITIQLIENIQREDLDELEEAEGYENLLKQTDSNGTPYTVQTISDVMGVSRSTIYARMKLLDLCPEARDALHAGKMDASTALLIARIPVHKLQLEALKDVTETMSHNWIDEGKVKGDKVLSYRAARAILQDRYMLDLADAPFDTKDPELVPKAGSCTDCTKRTGNQPDIFDDVGSKDVCTDPTCHAIKKTAHVLALQKKYEAEGNKLLVGKAATKIIPKNYMQSTEDCLKDHGLVKLDARVPGDDQNRTWEQLLKEKKILNNKKTEKPAIAKTVIENPRNTGEMIETISIEEATKKLREIAGYEIAIKPVASKQDNDAKQAKQREKEKRELAIENAFRARLFDTLHTRIEADMLDPKSNTFPKLYRRLAVQMWQDHDYCETEDLVALIRKYTTLPEAQEGAEIDWQSHIREFGDNIPNLPPAQHLMLIIELPLLVTEISTGYYASKADTMLDLASELGIDADSIRKDAAAEHKAAQAAAKKAEKPAAKPAKKTGSAKKQPEATTDAASTDPESVDDMYGTAADLVLKNQKASISMVQRELRIGYNRAARLIEDMEKTGLVSAIKSDGSRDVLKPAPQVRSAATWPFPVPPAKGEGKGGKE